mgnify:FL=1
MGVDVVNTLNTQLPGMLEAIHCHQTEIEGKNTKLVRELKIKHSADLEMLA